jgi:hypothetical protein
MMWYLLHASIIFAVVASNINFDLDPHFSGWVGNTSPNSVLLSSTTTN